MAARKGRVSFESVTVRAAARLIQLHRNRLLSAGELAWYLGELTDLDPLTTCGDGRVLGRLAHRYLARGGAVAAGSTASHPMDGVIHRAANSLRRHDRIATTDSGIPASR